jgi:hypothetical protein
VRPSRPRHRTITSGLPLRQLYSWTRSTIARLRASHDSTRTLHATTRMHEHRIGCEARGDRHPIAGVKCMHVTDQQIAHGLLVDHGVHN